MELSITIKNIIIMFCMLSRFILLQLVSFNTIQMNRQQRHAQTQLLLTWINHALGTSLSELIQLWNCQIFHRILSMIPDISLRPYKPNPCNMWQLAFTNSKTIYRSIEVYWTKVLNKSWQAHAYIDLLKLSKERNQEQIFELLILVFGCCVQCEEKDRFMEPIYKFNQIEHGEFMGMLHKYRFEDKLLDNKVIQIKDLMTKVEVLQIENDNLEKAMNDQLIELQLLQESINYLSEENKKAKEEIKASASIRVKTQNYMENNISQQQSLDTSITYGSPSRTTQDQRNSIQSQHHKQSQKVIEQLKAKVHDDKQNYMKQVGQLKQTIEFLKETISGNRKDRGVSSRRMSKGISQRIETDHPPCVSLAKYQQVVFGQTEKLKEIAKKEEEKNKHIEKLEIELKEIKELKLKEIKDVKEKQKQKEKYKEKQKQKQKQKEQQKLKEIRQTKEVSSIHGVQRKEKSIEPVIDYENLKLNILQGIKNNLEQYSRRKIPNVNNYLVR